MDVGNYVYHPGMNDIPTFAGIGGDQWGGVNNNVSKELGDGLFPVTYSQKYNFTCQ